MTVLIKAWAKDPVKESWLSKPFKLPAVPRVGDSIPLFEAKVPGNGKTLLITQVIWTPRPTIILETPTSQVADLMRKDKWKEVTLG